METTKKKIAIIENHELGIYTIRHDLVTAMAEKYDVSVLTEIDDSFTNTDLENTVRFIDVGKSVMNPVAAVRYNARVRKALQHIKPDVCLTFTIQIGRAHV